jgi:hypothetical protein
MVLPHHAGKFFPKTKGFFSHDFTLIASVVGESVIGHGIGGILIPAKMARLAESQSLEQATPVSPRHPISQPIKLVMAGKIHLRRRHVLNRIP